jgi:hypothetical protein
MNNGLIPTINEAETILLFGSGGHKKTYPKKSDRHLPSLKVTEM